MSGDPDSAARLAAVQARFAGKLRDRIDELARAVAAAESDPPQLTKAIELAHRLAGTAGSFGFAAAGEAALHLEGRLIALRDGTDDAPAWPDLHAALHDVVATKPPG